MERNVLFSIEKLIEAVKKRPALWDLKSYNYNTRSHVRDLWDQVSVELAMSDNICKSKWRNIRDVYRREFKKYRARLGNGDNTQEPRWMYYKQLQFLSDTINIDEKEGQDLDNTEEEPYESYYIKDSFIPSPDPDSKSPTNTNTFYFQAHSLNTNSTLSINSHSSNIDLEPGTMKREILDEDDCNIQNTSKKRRLTDNVEVEKNLEGKLIENRDKETKEEVDSDYHFLMSLLPFMRAVPLNKKLIIRSKLQNIISEELD